MSQPFGISCKGGLNTNLNEFEMLKQPGLASKLQNFEVDPDGGYRRIQGYRLLVQKVQQGLTAQTEFWFNSLCFGACSVCWTKRILH